MKLKNISIDELQELIPFIDHKKTLENAKYLINFTEQILNTYDFYYVREIANIDTLLESDFNFNDIVELKIENLNNDTIKDILNISSKVLDETEKIYFYLKILKGYTQDQLIDGNNELHYPINNQARIKNSIIRKFMFSMQNVIEYTQFDSTEKEAYLKCLN